LDVIRITRAIPQKEMTLGIDHKPPREGKPEAFRVVVSGMLTAGDVARMEPEAATAGRQG
jgi:DNA gyrase inhibitor GyrI